MTSRKKSNTSPKIISAPAIDPWARVATQSKNVYPVRQPEDRDLNDLMKFYGVKTSRSAERAAMKDVEAGLLIKVGKVHDEKTGQHPKVWRPA